MSASGVDFRIMRLIPVVLAGSVCFTLLGLGLTARVETLNEFLVKSQFFLLPMALPLIRFVEPGATFWVAWMPGHAVLALLKGAWSGMAPAEAAEATALLAVWGILFYVWAKSSFVRYVQERIGSGTS